MERRKEGREGTTSCTTSTAGNPSLCSSPLLRLLLLSLPPRLYSFFVRSLSRPIDRRNSQALLSFSFLRHPLFTRRTEASKQLMLTFVAI